MLGVYAVLTLLTSALASHAQEASIRFPQEPIKTPQAVSTLSGDQLFVIDSDVPILVFASPQGLVSLTEETGPLRIRERGKTTTYKGKHLVIVEAVASGHVELIVVAVGATKASDAIRKQLQVDVGPRPPPDPTPPKTPVAHWTFVVVSPNVVVNDPGFRQTLKDNGIKAYVMAANDPDLRAKGLSKAVDAAGGAPCMIAQDNEGNVLGQARLTDVAAARQFLQTLTGK